MTDLFDNLRFPPFITRASSSGPLSLSVRNIARESSDGCSRPRSSSKPAWIPRDRLVPPPERTAAKTLESLDGGTCKNN